MSELVCKRCGSKDYVKSGNVRGKQRYLCKDVECGCHFTEGDGRLLNAKSKAMRQLAMLLYGVGGMSFNAIGRVLQVSDVFVGRWIKEDAKEISEPEITAETNIVIIDEMWHFLKKKLKNCGCGAQYVVSVAEPLDGSWVIVVKKLVKN